MALIFNAPSWYNFQKCIVIRRMIYLASKSPRRQELLALMKVGFTVVRVDVPEIIGLNEDLEEYSRRVTKDKLAAAWKKIREDKLTPYPVLSADTEVIFKDKIIGKPESRMDAFNMLKAYSNTEHIVLTTIALKYNKFEETVSNKTLVTFSKLSDEVINKYLDEEEYIDKAGGYGIQSSIAQYINRIEGCYYSVMGLPLHDVRILLEKWKRYDQNFQSK